MKMAGETLILCESTELFSRLQDQHDDVREEMMRFIGEMIYDWAKDCQIDPDCEIKLRPYLTTLLRLSYECPFEQERRRCRQLLKNLKEAFGITIPQRLHSKPSQFIEIDGNEFRDESVRNLFIESYMVTGRVTNISRIMSFHPTYMKIYQDTYNQLFYGSGPLPFHWRHYIAILAASRHKCLYMMQFHAEAFRLYERDIEWLNGLSYAPQKLINFIELLNLLTFEPWTIQKEHIDALVLGEHNWSVSELVQAIIIASHIVSVVGFYYGCGIHDEIDFSGGHTYSTETITNGRNPDDMLVHQLNQTKKQNITGEEKRNKLVVVMNEYKELQERHQLLSEDKVLQEFDRFFRHEDSDLVDESEIDEKLAIIDHFMDNGSVQQLIDFTKISSQERQEKALSIQEFSWEDQGYSVISRYYKDIVRLLDDKFRVISTLTYNSIGDITNTDTKVLRTAVWNYIQVIKGIRDEYLYSSINELVEADFKRYIKVVVCKPEKNTKYLFHSGVFLYHASEQIHLNLLFMEARNQAQLLHVLHAIMQHSLS